MSCFLPRVGAIFIPEAGITGNNTSSSSTATRPSSNNIIENNSSSSSRIASSSVNDDTEYNSSERIVHSAGDIGGSNRTAGLDSMPDDVVVCAGGAQRSTMSYSRPHRNNKRSTNEAMDF